jgi:hypothetical protein
MSFGNLLFDLQAPARNFVRLIEKNNKKIVNKKYALVFNQTCINEELLPNYTNIYIIIRWQKFLDYMRTIYDQRVHLNFQGVEQFLDDVGRSKGRFSK